MKSKRLVTVIWTAVALVIFALAFFIISFLTPAEQAEELSGFGKIFASSPEFVFEKGRFLLTFGDFSVNIILIALLMVPLAVSCMIPEISIATSAIVAVAVGFGISGAIPLLREQIAGGASSWDVAAGAFWYISFLLAVLIVNGLVGIISKLFGMIIITTSAQVTVSLIVSTLLANAIAIILCLFAYLTVGLGWCGGLLLWFIIAILFVIFCEVMNIFELW